MDIAVVTVGMMQLAADQIIHVVAMRHGLMAATWPVLVTLALRSRSACDGVFGTRSDNVFVDVVFVNVMQVAVVQIIGVIAVADGKVTTVSAMLVVMVGVFGAGAHNS